MAIRFLFIYVFLFGLYLSILGQTEWVSYSRDDIGMSTIEKVQNVSWTKVESQPNPNKGLKIATDKTLKVIPNVIEEKLPKVIFEKINIVKSEVVEDLEFEYRELAKMDITCLNTIRAPYLKDMQAIAQFHNGKMIFGGFDVICIYDGYKMEVFNSSTEYIFNEIFSIVIDAQDRAWIASDAGIAYYDKGKFYKASNLEVGKVWNYWESSAGEVYVATCNNGVYILGAEQTNHIFKANKIQEVLDFIQTKDGTLWYGLDNGLALKKDSVWHEYTFGEIQGSVRSLLEVGSKLFIGTFQGGLYCLENDSIFKIDIPIINNFSIYNLQFIDGELWVPLYGRGVLVLDENLDFYRIKEEDGLVGNGTIKVFHDSFGNVWASDISKGLSKIRDTKFTPITYDIPDFKWRKSLVVDGVKWFFGDKGRIFRKIGDEYFILNYKGDGFLQDGDIKYVEYAAFSNFDQGVQLYRNNKIHTYLTDENDYQGSFSRPRYGNNNEIYYTNYHEEVRYFRNDSVFNLALLAPFKDRRVQQYVPANDRSMAVQLNNAVAFLKVDEYILYNEGNGLLSNWIYAIIPWEENQFCVIMDKGIQLFQNGKIISSFPIDILSQGRECMAKGIGNQQILLMSNLDVFVFEITDSNLEQKELDVPKGNYLIDHLIIDDNNTAISVKKNTICYDFNPFAKQRIGNSSTLHLDSVLVNDKVVNLMSYKYAQTDQIKLKLSYVSLVEKGNIHYLLKKEDKIIQEGSLQDRELIFSNLIKGNYKVEIYHEANSKKSNTITLDFTVVPYWYQTIWFYMVVICIVALSFYFYIKYRALKAKQNEIRLEGIVAAKTQELIVEKQSVEQQLEEKEVLLKEINHRVKNNMQMVSSLLELQAGRSNSVVAKETLKNAGKRIKSLAYAHQELYLNNDYSNLVLADYLDLLISKLLNNSEVTYDIEIDNSLSLDIEKAQAIGLVINELITNSIQHAWSEEDEKKIIVEIQKMNNGQWNLTYKDNGQGLIKDFKVENTKSLGFTLIKSFVNRQLKGTYSLRNEHGFVFEIQFKP